MDGRGGCCIARYATSGSAYDASKVDRIMLRFRPIAPKPSSGVPSSGGSSTESRDSSVKTGRGMRFYLRTSDKGNRKRCSRKRRQAAASGNTTKRDVASAGYNPAVVTLPLLPETPELGPPENKVMGRSNGVARGSSYGIRNAIGTSGTYDNPCLGEQPLEEVHVMRLNFSSHGRAALLLQPTRKLVEAWLTVECVTDTWVDWYALGCTNEERRRSLGEDACPGFVSDGLGMVTWTNTAFRRMVAGQYGESEVDMAVWLVMKDQRVTVTVALLANPAADFACRVRTQYTRGKERRSLTLPCDVWGIDGGGFAWRLDVKAALSLGR